jgi:hypothetical protein
MRIQVAVSLVVLALTACAKTPGTISTANLEEGRYANLSCEQLVAERARLDITSELANSNEATSKTTEEALAQNSEREAIALAMKNRGCPESPPATVASASRQPAAKPVKITQ